MLEIVVGLSVVGKSVTVYMEFNVFLHCLVWYMYVISFLIRIFMCVYDITMYSFGYIIDLLNLLTVHFNLLILNLCFSVLESYRYHFKHQNHYSSWFSDIVSRGR